ncbi:MAG: SMP-30/gluconolactonase/LRE family protein [Acidobacteria bacterium]|nr:SMP-30/gluconolactonase/LRE family protein [Acidobacteriota bacterium]
MPLRHLLLAFSLLSAAAAQDFSDLRIEHLSSGYQFTEGPVWSRDNFLVFSDIPAGKIYKWVPGAKPVVIRADSNNANGNTYDEKGRLYTCEAKLRRVVRFERSGRVTIIADRYLGKKLNEPNDVVVRHDGNIYFTDPAFGTADERRELDFYGVYHVDPKGELEVIAKPEGRPNGIALSPGGKILYVTNSDEKNIRAYDLDRRGAASNERLLVQNIRGVPDGMCVDEKGNHYVAAAGLEIYTPEGKPLASVPLALPPSNCAFGDPDFQTLFVTARSVIYRIRLNVKGAVSY